ncbi:hypothetical protein [Calothrix sp. 336/3]|uniref:hypothetical protein n=1 Tax=Calothrix sp. 336/3 TaxID=1337936 RepID=UPI0004E2CB48|nr:hypothetical protein [Calothrix sp. 336/3]AKG22264.1 hypothetical protein IJ00_14230 [Calothrix sp. 336/3]
MKLNGSDATNQPAAIDSKISPHRGSGILVTCEDFLQILNKTTEPLVIFTSEGFFTKIYKYITAYKGFIFFTETLSKLDLGSHVEVIHALSLSTDI